MKTKLTDEQLMLLKAIAIDEPLLNIIVVDYDWGTGMDGLKAMLNRIIRNKEYDVNVGNDKTYLNELRTAYIKYRCKLKRN